MTRIQKSSRNSTRISHMSRNCHGNRRGKGMWLRVRISLAVRQKKIGVVALVFVA